MMITKRKSRTIEIRDLEEFVRLLKENKVKRVRIDVKRTYNPRRTREIIRLISVAQLGNEKIAYVATRIEASTIRATFVTERIEEELCTVKQNLLERFAKEGFEIVESRGDRS